MRFSMPACACSGSDLARQFAVRRLVAGALCIAAMAVAGCAANRGARGPSTNTNLITQQEIEDSHQPNLFDVVRALRPMWLRQITATVQSSQDIGVTVYVDNQRVGSVDVLREMPPTNAVSLHYYSASEAQSHFGLGNLHGVIQVITPRGSP